MVPQAFAQSVIPLAPDFLSCLLAVCVRRTKKPLSLKFTKCKAVTHLS